MSLIDRGVYSPGIPGLNQLGEEFLKKNGLCRPRGPDLLSPIVWEAVQKQTVPVAKEGVSEPWAAPFIHQGGSEPWTAHVVHKVVSEPWIVPAVHE